MSSFFDCGACAKLGEDNFLMKLNKIISWEELRKYLKYLHKNDICPSNGGKKPYDPLKMLKSLILGQWYNLSDSALEESLRVRLDFMVFTGFEMLDDVPDSTTLCRFRNKLISKNLYKKLLSEINIQLENTGIKVQKAPDAKWLKKGSKSYFGYKGFITTEEEGFVENVHVTSANVSRDKRVKNFLIGND